MRQLTIRGFDLELEQTIRSLARREGISMNKAALRLLRRGADLLENREGGRIGMRLNKYAGTMTDEEASELLGSIAQTEQIDADLWR